MNLKNAVTLFLISISLQLSAQTDSLYLWPNAVPGESSPKKEPVPTTLEDGSIRVIEVTNPFVAVFKPDPAVKNGKAIIVFTILFDYSIPAKSLLYIFPVNIGLIEPFAHPDV